MISVADWINGFRARALRDKDDARLRLTDFYLLSRSLKSEHPDQKLARYEAGGNLARQLGEPWWQLFFEFWKISTLLCDKLDTSAALDLAVRAARSRQTALRWVSRTSDA